MFFPFGFCEFFRGTDYGVFIQKGGVVDGRVIRAAGKPRALSPPTTAVVVVLCFVVSSGPSEFERCVSS